MQFNTGTPSLVSYTKLLAGQASVAVGDLFPEQEVKDAVNFSYEELWTQGKDANIGWGRTTAYDDSVEDQILYDIPTDLDGDIISVALETEGKDLSSDSTANFTYLTPSEHEFALTQYRLGNITAPEYFYLELGTGAKKFGIVSPPGASGTNSIEIVYEAELTLLSADADIPEIPRSHHRLICYLAAITLRTQKDLPSNELQIETARLYPSFLERISEVALDLDYQPPAAGRIDRKTPFATGFINRT